MTEMRPRWWEGLHEHHFPCECGDWHYLHVQVDDTDPEFCLLNIADTWEPVGWRDRLKAAWKMLRGQTHYAAGVLLNEPNVRDLKAVVDALHERYEQ